MTKDRITTGAFVLSLLFHLALFSFHFSISAPEPLQEMVIEMASIEIEPPPVEEVVIKEEEPSPEPESEPEPKPEPPPPEPLSPKSEPEQEPKPMPEPESEPLSEEPTPLPAVEDIFPEVKEVKKNVTLARDVATSTPVVRVAQALPLPKKKDNTKKTEKNFLQLVRRKIERVKYYPQWARQREFEGAVRVKFIIEKGDVNDIEIVESSGCKILDKAALITIKRAAPFSELPKKLGEELKITIPISYRLVGE